MQYRTDIDGIRAIAVAMVLGYHAGLPGFAGGFVGVDVFFVLSGYLMAALLKEETEARGRIDLPAFLLRRIRRLLPLILVVGLATAAAGWFLLLPPQFKDFGQSLVLSLLFGANWLFWHEAGYFGAAAEGKPLLHLWSLGVEGQFYLVIAALGWAWARWGGPALRVMLGLAALSFAAAVAASVHWPQSAFYLLPFRFWEFAAGALLGLVPSVPRLRGAGAVGLVCLALSLWLVTGAEPFPGWVALLPVTGAMALLMARGRVVRLLRLRPLRWLGRNSYGIYLWHYPAVVLGAIAWPDLPAWAMLPAVLALAQVTRIAVEEPFRRGRLRGLPVPALPGAALAAALLGVGLHLTAGAPSRLPPAAQDTLGQLEAWVMPCHDKLAVDAVKAGARCRIGAQDARPTIALLGDSHAGHLTPALEPLLAERGLAAVVFSRGWCAPLPAFGTSAPNRGPDCAAFMSAAWAQVLAEPGLRQVVLSAQWANFTAGTREGLVAVTYGEATAPAENPLAFDRAMRALAGRLDGAGRRLIVVEPVPEFGVPVPEAILRKAWAREARPTRAAPVPYVERNGEALATLAQFKAQTGAEVVRPLALFCDEGGRLCDVADGQGAPLYRDRGHLSSRGAERVAVALADLLEAGARGAAE